jgi:hypothetical protein
MARPFFVPLRFETLGQTVPRRCESIERQGVEVLRLHDLKVGFVRHRIRSPQEHFGQGLVPGQRIVAQDLDSDMVGTGFDMGAEAGPHLL